MEQLRRFFEDDQGNLVLCQRPNVPLIIALAFSVATLVIPSGAAANLITLLAINCWIIWSVLEAVWGDSPFRRALGLVALIITLLVAIKYVLVL